MPAKPAGRWQKLPAAQSLVVRQAAPVEAWLQTPSPWSGGFTHVPLPHAALERQTLPSGSCTFDGARAVPELEEEAPVAQPISTLHSKTR